MTNKGKRRMCFFLFFLLIVMNVLLLKCYRTYIYENSIFDYHFADTFVNIIYVPACIFLCYCIKSSKYRLESIVLGVTGWLIAYELACLFEPLKLGVFDIYDIIATIGSGVVTYLLLKYTSILPKPENNESKREVNYEKS